jgi:hypothetical protein
MLKGAYDIFALVINFLDENWQPKKVTIGLFEAIETIGQTLAKNLKELFDSYGLSKKIIAYVTNEGEKLNSMTTIFKSIINCEVLGLEENFHGIFFGHAFSKTCQYAIFERRVCKIFKYVSIKSRQFDMQKCMTWQKNLEIENKSG